MVNEIIRMSPEFALVSALNEVPVLGGKIAAMQPKKDWKPPFVFYIPTRDTEERTLEGPSGLQSFEAGLHLVAGTHRGLQLLCQRMKKAVYEMPGMVYVTPAHAPEDGPRGAVLIEDAELEQTSPDLFEAEVAYYRRVYQIRLDYQTEEVAEDED